MVDERDMLRPADIAKKLGITRSRLYQLIADGEIPVTKVGRAYRIPRAAWNRWLRARSHEALAALKNPSDSVPGKEVLEP